MHREPRTGPRDVFGTPLTPRMREAIAESFLHGHSATAARCMGISQQTFKNLIASSLNRTGAVDGRHLGVVLGWITIPDGVARPHERTGTDVTAIGREVVTHEAVA